MRSGGELLERARLMRTGYVEGSKVKALDGVANYKPIGAH